MKHRRVFISHSSKDDAFVKELRAALESLGVPVWADSRALRGGAKLAPEVEEAIKGARQFVAVISTNTVNAPWVRREIQKALEVEAVRGVEGYRVIPLLLPGIEPSALPLFFDDEPVGVRVELSAGSLAEALPDLLAALGERPPGDRSRAEVVSPRPVEELLLWLEDLRIETGDGKRRARAVARLVYEPADPAERAVESRRFNFTAPLGPLEAEELRWYLEEYFVWPVGVFRERAEKIEALLPQWGQALYEAAFPADEVCAPLDAWRFLAKEGERRLSVLVIADPPSDNRGEERRSAANEAAAELLSLPWELLHDGSGFLFHGKNPVRVRRRLPNRHRQPVRPTRLPVRILFVSPRPDNLHYTDHRASALPLVEAVEGLGGLARLTVLTPPTFPALEEALNRAAAAGEPFDVVHFDGHGVYDRGVGLGGLCFEAAGDVGKSGRRVTELVHAERLAEVVRDYRVPLIFLEAGQTAKTEEDPTSSVAAKLLEEGVTSVVAMSHSVLVETARRFVGAFYSELARGKRVGTAMLMGQRELYRDPFRGRMLGAGELRLQDWFVPVLYQEEQDPQLVSVLPPEEVRLLEGKRRRLSLGELPAPPGHGFVGRSRELLSLERLLDVEPWAVMRGQGGEGKTTLAAELARWLVRTGRSSRAAFVSLERFADARGVLDGLGRQLLPDYFVADYADLKQALQPVARALRETPTLVVLDNLESVLPDAEGRPPAGAVPVEELFALFRGLLDAGPATRLVFTTRQPLPAPFDDRNRELTLGALSREDAIRLVGEVMKLGGLEPKAGDLGKEPEEIVQLVEAVGRHARALVLLSREVAGRGVRATTENLRRLMEELHAKFPGDRENSLYASLELSLGRLPAGSRESVRALANFHGGAHLFVLARVLGVGPEEATGLARQLIEVGLAEDMGGGHLRLDPALPPYLLSEVSEAERAKARDRWAEAMQELVTFIYGQRFEDAGLASRLALLELPNLLALLQWAEQHSPPGEAVELAGKIESLLSGLDRPQALAAAVGVRERAARRLGEWGHARYLAERAEIARLFERGQLPAAFEAAEKLLRRCLEAGEGAYPGADYDLSMAYFMLGRVLKTGGAVEEALTLLNQAMSRFNALAAQGNTAAARAASTTLTESADCLSELGRLDEAAAAYEESSKRAAELGDHRGEAVTRAQFGTLLLMQGRYDEALAAYEKARKTFEEIGETRSVAVALHQIGRVHREAGQYAQAERAFRQSLAISVQQKDPAGEATTLGEVGNLYGSMGRLEEAVKFLAQAADIYVRLRDQRREGMARSNLAYVLMTSGRYDEARREALRAVECDEPYGHAAEPWKSWEILRQLEETVGNTQAAARARQRAFDSYLAYRREGGYSTSPAAQFCTAVAEAIRAGDTSEIEDLLAVRPRENYAPRAKALLPKLLAVLRGDRDPSLAADPELDFAAAAELVLLLESLESSSKASAPPHSRKPETGAK